MTVTHWPLNLFHLAALFLLRYNFITVNWRKIYLINITIFFYVFIKTMILKNVAFELYSFNLVRNIRLKEKENVLQNHETNQQVLFKEISQPNKNKIK